MFTRSDRRSGRGAHVTWVSALGLVLLALGLVASQTSGFAVVAGDQLRQSETQGASAAGAAAQVPFVVEPQVRFEEADPPGPSRSAGPLAASGVPLRLVVPGLGVHAPVVGISASDGILLPPDDPRTLGWWSDGARPGAALGGALIAGHTVHTGGGAFNDLETLEAGDRVMVHTAQGVLRYAVSGVTIYRKASLARDAEKLFSQTVPGRLVLVTCEDWDGQAYRSNAVVFADPIPGA